MSTNNSQNEVQQVSPADYQDLDMAKLQVISDYLMKQSVPQGLTISETQMVIEYFMELLNISLSNLNLLRSMAGISPMEITKEEMA